MEKLGINRAASRAAEPAMPAAAQSPLGSKVDDHEMASCC